MARRALMLLPIMLVLFGNRGCQTTSQRMQEAYAAKGAAEASEELPRELPDACISHIAPVQRKAGDYASHIIGEYERVVIPDRNQRADDCAAWWAAYHSSLAGDTQ